MICGNCGKEMQAGDRFCMTCGWRAPEETAQAAAASQATDAPQATGAPQENVPASVP